MLRRNLIACLVVIAGAGWLASRPQPTGPAGLQPSMAKWRGRRRRMNRRVRHVQYPRLHRRRRAAGRRARCGVPRWHRLRRGSNEVHGPRPLGARTTRRRLARAENSGMHWLFVPGTSATGTRSISATDLLTCVAGGIVAADPAYGANNGRGYRNAVLDAACGFASDRFDVLLTHIARRRSDRVQSRRAPRGDRSLTFRCRRRRCCLAT